uniref:Si:dkey-14d8.1 n=1 Tax=Cyprinus carpio carpio TaxID=630221 RepID=A0A8C1ETH3_CYPCA
MSAFLWQVVQRRNVTQYGKLEQFVVLVTETVPDIMSRSLVNKLIFHLRKKVILELCLKDKMPDLWVIQAHLDSLRNLTHKVINVAFVIALTMYRNTVLACYQMVHNILEDAEKKENFIQHVFPVEYGSGYDAVLQSLAWEFLSRVEDLLPVPNLKEVHLSIFLRFFFLLVCTVSIPSTAEVVCLPHPVSPTIAIEHEETLPPTSIAQETIIIESEGTENQSESDYAAIAIMSPSQSYTEEAEPLVDSEEFTAIAATEEAEEGLQQEEAAATPSESQTSQEEKRHSCPECHKEFRFECLLRNHMRTHTGERPFQCSDCGKSFRCLSFLTNHIKTHSLARPFKCIQCVKTFRKKADLIKHIRVHTGEKPYKCTICGKSFSQGSYLKIHRECHTSENLHQCPHCNKSFPTAFKLSIHVRYHSMERSYQCNQCGKSFIYASLLRRHKGYHAGERQHLCSICGKSFVYMFDLKKHQRNHERPQIKIPCTLCNKTFAGPEMLRCHLRIHTGERPFRCKICGKAFSQIGNMKRHERVHTGERPFTCERCGKTYKHSSHLKNHMLSHTGERPWQCSHCGKSFKFAGPLKKHERTHLGERGNRRRSYDQTRSRIKPEPKSP